MGIEKDSQEQTVARCQVPPLGWRCTRGAGHEGPCAAVEDVDLGPVIWEQAYDKGYDDGWKARDEMAGRNLKIAEDLAYDNGWIAGANAVINRKPYSAIAGR